MLLFGAKPTVNTVFVEFMPIVTAKCEGLFFLVLFGFNDVNVLRTGRNVLGACPPIADNDVGPLTAVDMVLKCMSKPVPLARALAAPPSTSIEAKDDIPGVKQAANLSGGAERKAHVDGIRQRPVPRHREMASQKLLIKNRSMIDDTIEREKKRRVKV